MSRIAATSAIYCLIVVGLSYGVSLVTSFEWSAAGPHSIDRRAIAGIWKLTSLVRPMKEFTVYPKKAKPLQPDVLLMLKEDGSFKQCVNQASDESKDVDTSWSFYQRNQIKEESYLGSFVKGTWEYQDGQLMLAADRRSEDDPAQLYQSLSDGYPSSGVSTVTSIANHQDTLLKGRLVATCQPRLGDNPVLAPNATATSSIASTPAIDTHLSVPKGSIHVGKFIYPRTHPSFFDQPMFQPMKKGTFALRQILGNLNTRDDEAVVEKFCRADFYKKTFLLTAHPLGFRSAPPQGEKRWSIKYNQFVYDPPSKKAKDTADEANKRLTAGLRVLQLTFHANNTFSTTAGLGTSAILRGTFDVIGREKDHLWMQVMRFGFGRSVSGSVYSEGPMLSNEDAKAYWGSIRSETKAQGDAAQSASMSKVPTGTGAQQPIRLEVEGSVLDGWGLEPSPVARFIMRETSDTSLLDDEDEEDEDEVVAQDDVSFGADDGVDWSQSGKSFQ